MAVRAARTNAGGVLVVGRELPFRTDIVAHLVAGNTELHGVGVFHEGIETAPENDSGDSAGGKDRAEAPACRRGPQPEP